MNAPLDVRGVGEAGREGLAVDVEQLAVALAHLVSLAARDAAGRAWLDARRFEGDADIGSYKTDAALRARDVVRRILLFSRPETEGRTSLAVEPLLDETVRRVGGQRPLMVGDRLDTDIEGANATGYDSLLVLTGVTDLAALVAAVGRLLVEDAAIAEIDLNPVIAGPGGAVAVDALVVVAAPGATPPVPTGVRVVHDATAFEGPLAGLATGLAALATDVVTSAKTASASLVQGIVDSYNKILGEANDADANAGDSVADATPTADPLASDYANIGAQTLISAPGGGCGTQSVSCVPGYTSDGPAVYSLGNSGTSTPVADSATLKYGTSMAVPHVVGTIALMLSLNPALTRSEVIALLRNSARALPPAVISM